MYKIIDCEFNRRWYPHLIGKVVKNVIPYVVVEKVEEPKTFICAEVDKCPNVCKEYGMAHLNKVPDEDSYCLVLGRRALDREIPITQLKENGK